MRLTRLRPLFALTAIALMIAAAYTLRPPNEGALRKAYIINQRSMEHIADPISQWSHAYAFQLIAGDGTPVKLGLSLMLLGGLLLGLSLNLGKPPSPTPTSGDALPPTPLSMQWGGAGGGDSFLPLADSERGPGGEVSSSPLPMFGEGPGVGLTSKSGLGYIRLIIGLLCLAILTERNGDLLNLTFLRHLNIHLQATLLLFGLLFTTWGLIGRLPLAKWRGGRGVRSALLPSPLSGEGPGVGMGLLPLAAITLLALILRAWRLETAIHGLIDEMHFINAVTLLWQYPNDIRLLQPFSTIPAFPWVFPYAQSGGVEIFGNNLTGIRVLSVLIGTVTIPALYLLARSLFDKPTALIAALILATFPPHLHFSRAGINNIADPLMGTAALAFLAYGFRIRQRWPFVLAGVALGLTQYFYDGGRLLYPALTLVWLILSAIFTRPTKPSITRREGSVTPPIFPDTPLDPAASPPRQIETGPTGALPPTPLSIQRAGAGGGDIALPLADSERGSGGEVSSPTRRRTRIYLLAFLVAFLLIAAPIYYTRYGQASGFSSRGQDVSAGSDFWRTVLIGDSGERVYLRHLAYTFFIYVYMPEMSWFYGGDTPLILHIFVPLFLLGLFWAMWHWRRAGPLLLILWLMLVAFGNTLLRESATSARYVVVFPALALLMAIGLRQSVALLLSDHLTKRTQYALLTVLVIAIAVTQTGYYFDRHIDAWNNGRLTLDADDAMFRAADLPPHTHVHIVHDIEIMRFNLDTLRRYLHRTDLDVLPMYPDRFNSFYLDGLPRDVNHAFFLPPDRVDLVALLVAYFELDPPQYSPYAVPRQNQFVLYFAPAAKNTTPPGDELWMRRANQP